MIVAETWTEVLEENICFLMPAYERDSLVDYYGMAYIVTWRDPYTRNFTAGLVKGEELEKLAKALFPSGLAYYRDGG